MLETIERLTGPQPTAAIIWMHGLGADNRDFLPIVGEMDLAGVPDIRFVFPNAETMPVTINNGYVMRSWYDLLSRSLDSVEDEAGLVASQKAVAELIEQEIQRGIAPERIIIAGFSQGAAMTLQTGLRSAHRLGGLICLSGYLPLRHQLSQMRHEANLNTPIFIAHGSADPVVVIDRGLATRDILLREGYQVEWHEYPMEHSLCAAEVDAIAQFIRRIVSPTAL